jgi:hypothetical protein
MAAMNVEPVRPSFLRGFRLVVALAIAVALTSQFVISLGIESFRPLNFFSYFTVLSNISAVLVLSLMAIQPGRSQMPSFIPFRGASTLYMAVTGVVYVTILLPIQTDVGVSEPWIDWVIHGIGPLFMIADWIFDRPPRLGFGSLWGWLLFPLVYLTYSLVRGPIVDWYPYPFLDPRPPHDYAEVAIGSVFVLVAILVIGSALVWWTRSGMRRSRST